MTILAFLQNAYFKDPVRAERILRMYEEDPSRGRQLFVRDMLFMGCLTGKRLLKAFGKDVCMEIIWDEASPKIGGRSSAKFACDPEHMGRINDHFFPEVILIFGKVAFEGWQTAYGNHVEYPTAKFLIAGPHPADRRKTVTTDLENMARQLKEYRKSHCG